MVGKKKYSQKRGKMYRKNKNKVKLTKPLKLAVQRIINKNIETKCAYKQYATQTYTDRDDILAITQDIFGGIQQGAQDSSIPGSANRIGDAISARGILFNFRVTVRPVWTHAGVGYQLPYVYVRLMIIQGRNPLSVGGVPTKARVFDNNAMTANTAPTRIPFSLDNYGWAKKVLYNKVYKVRNDGLFINNGVATDSLMGNDMYFTKYIKYNKIIKYTDSVPGFADETTEPLFFCAIGETAPFLNTGMNLTANPLFTISGYTKVYFKDA